MPKPNFICIGAQRCGTTRLHEVLKSHPEVSMTSCGVDVFNKELHYFDDRVLDHGLSWYESCFKSTGVAGEISPAYAILSYKMVDLISRYLNECKILFIVRNPVERISSQLRMMRSKWAKSASGEVNLDDLVLIFDSPAVVLRSDYLRSLQIWSKCFGLNRVLVVNFEELLSDLGLRTVLSYLNVDKDWQPPEYISQPILPSPKDDLPVELHWLIADRWLKMCSKFVDLGFGSAQWVDQMIEYRKKMPESFMTKIKLIRSQQKTTTKLRWRSLITHNRHLEKSMRKRLVEHNLICME